MYPPFVLNCSNRDFNPRRGKDLGPSTVTVRLDNLTKLKIKKITNKTKNYKFNKKITKTYKKKYEKITKTIRKITKKIQKKITNK